MQIDVVENQIKFMLPGNTIISLSKDVVTTVTDWDIVSGVNSGASGSAKSLADRFKRMAETKELLKVLDAIYNSQRTTMKNLLAYLKKVMPLQELLRKRYQMSEAGTNTLTGYNGATAYNSGSATKTSQAATASNSATGKQNTNANENVSEEDDFQETKYYFRLVKAETVKKINKSMYIESISNSENSMSASVKPPKPKEPFSVSASWNSPPIEFYPGETINIKAKGTGDVRMTVEAFNADSHYASKNSVYEGGNYSVDFSWKVNAYGSLYITVQARVKAHVYAWSSTSYE